MMIPDQQYDNRNHHQRGDDPGSGKGKADGDDPDITQYSQKHKGGPIGHTAAL